jgi:hypothetical protein
MANALYRAAVARWPAARITRMVADQMTHEGVRTIMRRIAMHYDRLAKLAEEQLADQERGTIDANMSPSAATCSRVVAPYSAIGARLQLSQTSERGTARYRRRTSDD